MIVCKMPLHARGLSPKAANARPSARDYKVSCIQVSSKTTLKFHQFRSFKIQISRIQIELQRETNIILLEKQIFYFL